MWFRNTVELNVHARGRGTKKKRKQTRLRVDASYEIGNMDDDAVSWTHEGIAA